MTLSLVPVSGMTEREFGIVFSKLAIQLRWTDADVATVKVYFEALRDFTLPVLEQTARAFAQEHGRRFFPTTAEWHEAAATNRQAQFKQAVQPRSEVWHLECSSCEDTGWKPHECDGGSDCGRRKKHAAHHYVTPCPCRATNRTWLRHQKFGAGA